MRIRCTSHVIVPVPPRALSPLTTLCRCALRRASPQLTDLTQFLKILYVSLAALFALCGCGGVLALHANAPQKAPLVMEEEPVELYREVKVAT